MAPLSTYYRSSLKDSLPPLSGTITPSISCAALTLDILRWCQSRSQETVLDFSSSCIYVVSMQRWGKKVCNWSHQSWTHKEALPMCCSSCWDSQISLHPNQHNCLRFAKPGESFESSDDMTMLEYSPQRKHVLHPKQISVMS